MKAPFLSSFTEKHYKQGGTDFKSDQHFFGPFLKYEKQEGLCEELGHPLDQVEFIDIFKKHFKSSYEAYSSLPSERLFVVKPTFIQRWSYIGDQPIIEQFEIEQQIYREQHYPVDESHIY